MIPSRVVELFPQNGRKESIVPPIRNEAINLERDNSPKEKKGFYAMILPDG